MNKHSHHQVLPAFFSAAVIASVLAAPAASASIFETNDTQRANLSYCDEAFRKNIVQLGNDSAFIVRRGLVADIAKGEVRILAEACSIAPGATVEFPVLGELSDRDYEGLFRTFARPGEIAQALEKLGLPRGRNVDSGAASFWPMGERVSVSVIPLATNGVRSADAAEIPVRDFITDTTTGKAPHWESFVYCGSPDDKVAGKGARLADTTAPNSVLSTYNEPQTLLDLPEISGQSAVYERYILNKQAPFTPFSLYELVLRPVKTADGEPRVKNITLKMESDGKEGLLFTLGNGERHSDAAPLFAYFKKEAEKHDLFVSLDFGDSLTLRQAKGLAAAMTGVEGPAGIRIAPPPAGSFYCRGFLPSDELRAASTRISQPWEIHFTTNGAPAVLVKTLEDWSDPDSLDPVLTRKEFKVSSPAEAVTTVAANGDGLPGIIVYAPASSKLSLFMPYVRAMLEKHPTVYVFDEDVK